MVCGFLIICSVLEVDGETWKESTEILRLRFEQRFIIGERQGSVERRMVCSGSTPARRIEGRIITWSGVRRRSKYPMPEATGTHKGVSVPKKYGLNTEHSQKQKRKRTHLYIYSIHRRNPLDPKITCNTRKVQWYNREWNPSSELRQWKPKCTREYTQSVFQNSHILQSRSFLFLAFASR